MSLQQGNQGNIGELQTTWICTGSAVGCKVPLTNLSFFFFSALFLLFWVSHLHFFVSILVLTSICSNTMPIHINILFSFLPNKLCYTCQGSYVLLFIGLNNKCWLIVNVFFSFMQWTNSILFIIFCSYKLLKLPNISMSKNLRILLSNHQICPKEGKKYKKKWEMYKIDIGFLFFKSNLFFI